MIVHHISNVFWKFDYRPILYVDLNSYRSHCYLNLVKTLIKINDGIMLTWKILVNTRLFLPS